MSTFNPSPQSLSDPFDKSDPAGPADTGLGSARGIRWLLLVGALVVAVSVVRLVAAQWGGLPLALQFLIVAGGALTIFAIGDLTRRRLGLPVAGSALLFLFAALVPLWTWGAASLELLAEPSGWAVFVISVAGLWSALRHVLEKTLGYRGRLYPAALGLLLLAVPILPWLEDGLALDGHLVFLATASLLGLLLRAASRHVNRFFFHRDRRTGKLAGEHPVHLLPFALLTLLYGAAMSQLHAFDSHFALALIFVAVALIDTGEEYYRALVRATGGKPERWPRRSAGLLGLGFTAMAAALGFALFDLTGQVLALVTLIATARLLVWALRYRGTLAHVAALLTGIVAYHASPALVPEAVKELFHAVREAAGIGATSPAAVSLADLGLLASLLVLGFLLRERLTPAMARAHWVVSALSASFFLTVGLLDVHGLGFVAPAAALLLAAGIAFLRRRELLLPLYQALATTALAWSPPHAELLQEDSALWLAAANGLYLAAGWWTLRTARWTGGETRSVQRLLLIPALATTALMLPIPFAAPPLQAGGLALLIAATCAIAYRIRPYPSLFATALLASGGGLFLLGSAWGPTVAAYALLTAAVGYLGLATACRRAGRDDLSSFCRQGALAFGVVTAGQSVWATLLGAFGSDAATGSAWTAILPAFLASLFFALIAREPRPARTEPEDPADAISSPAPASYAEFVDRGGERWLAASLAAATFALAFIVLVGVVGTFASQLVWCGPGFALIGLSILMRRQLGDLWTRRVFTLGAGCLYAMPVLGLLEELTWGWQIVLLLLAVSFGALSFRLRSRSLLLVSTGALVTDLAFFLIKLRATEPMLLWAAGIAFGLALMGAAAFLEHRREKVVQNLRIWGHELRSWA